MNTVPTGGEHLTDEQQILAALDRGQRLLVVGGPSGTFPEKWTRHPQILHWPSTEKKPDDENRQIPHDIGALMICNMVSFSLQRNLAEQAKRRHIWTPGQVQSPGAIKRLVEPVLEMRKPKPTFTPTLVKPDPPVSTPTAAAQPEPAKADPAVQLFEDAILSIRLAAEAYTEIQTKIQQENETLRAENVRLQAELTNLQESTQGLASLRALLKNI